MNNLQLILLLFFISIGSTKAFTTLPDKESYLLGLGLVTEAGYSDAIYICNKNGNDTTGNGSLATPYATYAKVWSTLNTQPVGANGLAIAFCRGGTFYTDSNYTTNNVNVTKDKRITFRDYQPSDSSNRDMPKLVTTGDNKAGIRFGTKGKEGYIVKNIHFVGAYANHNVSGAAINVYNDLDYLEVDNIWAENHSVSVLLGSCNAVADLYADEVLSDLTFAHNAAEGVGDTITRASGTWGTLEAGDAVIITGSNYNNKKFRIASATPTVITLTEATGVWDLVDEVDTPNVTVKLQNYDCDNSFTTVKNSLIEKNGQGIYGQYGAYSRIENNIFKANGFYRFLLDHNLYLTNGDYVTVTNNIFQDNAPYQGEPCMAVQLVWHGKVNHPTVTYNTLIQRPSESGGGCWAIALDNGYATPEWFLNAYIAHNTIINGGGMAIGCTYCRDTVIEYNTIIDNRLSDKGSAEGIVVPSKIDVPKVGGVKTANVIIRHNKIIGQNTAASGNAGSNGIRIRGTTDITEGTIDVINNEISGMYGCLKNDYTGGATVNWGSGGTANTCTNYTVLGP